MQPEGGHESLAVYRDNSRPTLVAEEFRAMTDHMPELTTWTLDEAVKEGVTT